MLVLKTISVLFAALILFTHVSAASAPTVERKIPLTIPQMIVKYANEYNVSADVMNNVIKCESSFRVNAINKSEIEYSVGLSQINLNVHKDVTFEQAVDPEFAIEYMAKNIGKTPRMWSCYRNLYE